MIENELLQKNKEQEPTYTNYYTWYRYYQNLDHEIDLNVFFQEFRDDIGTDICFSKIFRLLEKYTNVDDYGPSKNMPIASFDINQSETIFIGIRLKDFKKRPDANNFCLIDPKYIDEWCNCFRDIIDYKATILFPPEKNPESCIVRLDFPTVSKFGNTERILLTWVRYLYEAPFNYCTLDAMRLKRVDKFKDYTLMDLFNLVSHCGSFGHFYWSDVHAVCKGGGIYPSAYMKEYMEASSKHKVNEFCKKYRYTGGSLYGSLTFNDMYDVIDPEKFEVRLKTYEETLKIFDEHFKTIK